MTSAPRQWVAWLAGILAVAAVLWTSAATACVICVPYPTTTHADLLIESESVIVAREDPERPFFYAPVEILKGALDGRPIDLFLDSTTRQRLRHYPDEGVLLYRRNADAPWQRLAYATTAYREAVGQLLEHAESWRGGLRKQERLEFFSRHLLSGDSTLREQAYLELGRAPYSWIARLAGRIPREEIRGFLSDDRMLEWHSLFILMLGQSDHPDDLEYIRANFESASRFTLTSNLSAWTVAFVEAHPETAIAEIETDIFANVARSSRTLEAVLQGLSVIASQDGILVPQRIAELRRRLIESYGALLELHPQLAGWVARDLALWKRQALVEPLTAIAAKEALLDPAARFAVESYLASASGFPE